MSSLKLFNVGPGSVVEIPARSVERERSLQGLVERHMETFLGVRFLASEYSTGPRHGGRIDSLGFDENGAPVIVECKRGQDAGVINQGLFYLSWLIDHKAEFQHLVRERLGAAAAAQVLWSDPRLICIAEEFTRYDAHAIGEIPRMSGLLQQLTKRILESALEGEITDHLGHEKHEKATDGNTRNGTRYKAVITEVGPVAIDVPRDREGSFEPQMVKERQHRLTGVDEMVLSLSARGPGGCRSADLSF
ncbi:hypothetical protein GCM10010359_01670 [Streptomyces morookaense]|nr:hypothetical protein GCM10010359_01670 [Streptomyces morookaense]